MSRFVSSIMAAICLFGFVAVPAEATQISSCVISGIDPANDSDLQTCRLDEVDGGLIQVTSMFPGDWFDSWVIVYDPGQPFIPANASDVLHFEESGTLTLWSDSADGFGAALNSAAVASDLFQLHENAISGAATTIYVNYQSSFNTIRSAFGDCGLTTNGSCDTINVFSFEDRTPGNGEVPEPATLTLVTLGGAIAYHRRKAGRPALFR